MKQTDCICVQVANCTLKRYCTFSLCQKRHGIAIERDPYSGVEQHQSYLFPSKPARGSPGRGPGPAEHPNAASPPPRPPRAPARAVRAHPAPRAALGSLPCTSCWAWLRSADPAPLRSEHDEFHWKPHSSLGQNFTFSPRSWGCSLGACPPVALPRPAASPEGPTGSGASHTPGKGRQPRAGGEARPGAGSGGPGGEAAERRYRSGPDVAVPGGSRPAPAGGARPGRPRGSRGGRGTDPPRLGEAGHAAEEPPMGQGKGLPAPASFGQREGARNSEQKFGAGEERGPVPVTWRHSRRGRPWPGRLARASCWRASGRGWAAFWGAAAALAAEALGSAQRRPFAAASSARPAPFGVTVIWQKLVTRRCQEGRRERGEGRRERGPAGGRGGPGGAAPRGEWSPADPAGSAGPGGSSGSPPSAASADPAAAACGGKAPAPGGAQPGAGPRNPPGAAITRRGCVFLLRTEVTGSSTRKARGGHDRGIRSFSWLYPAPLGLYVQGCSRKWWRLLPQPSKIQLLPALLPGTRSDSPTTVAEWLSSDALEPTVKVERV